MWFTLVFLVLVNILGLELAKKHVVDNGRNSGIVSRKTYRIFYFIPFLTLIALFLILIFSVCVLSYDAITEVIRDFKNKFPTL
jgi:hypothetical protein